MNEDLNFVTPNIMLVKHLVNNPKRLQEVEETLRVTGKINVDRHISFRTEEFAFDYDIKSLIVECDEVLDLVEILNLYLGEDRTEPYTFEEIMEDFDFEVIDLVCVICYQLTEIKDGVIFDCCSSIGHNDHIQQWLDDKQTCPYCYSKKFKLLQPEV